MSWSSVGLPMPACAACSWCCRALVFETRARSDAVIVGGNTVRRDNPRLTTRREGGHTPVRMVMSRTLDLPEVGAKRGPVDGVRDGTRIHLSYWNAGSYEQLGEATLAMQSTTSEPGQL